MKIADVVARVLVEKMDGAHRNPRFRWTHKQVLLVFVTTDDGRVGVGGRIAPPERPGLDLGDVLRGPARQEIAR